MEEAGLYSWSGQLPLTHGPVGKFRASDPNSGLWDLLGITVRPGAIQDLD